MVAEGAAGDGSAGVGAELEAGAGLGVVVVEGAEVLDVGRVDLGRLGFVADGDGGERGFPRGRCWAGGGRSRGGLWSG